MSLVPAQQRAWKVGEILHGYRVRSVLGDGAFSRVYHVEDLKTQTAYALKHVISTCDKEDRWVNQARAEWEVGSRLHHPAIRTVIDCRHDGWFLRNSRDVALVLELVDAQSLAEVQRPLMWACICIFRQVAAALQHMHETGFVHADMKPMNLLCSRNLRTRVIDLGQSVPIGFTKERIQGTPGYIAPEQAELQPLTEQTDVFNFAATMYSILLGRRSDGLLYLAPQAVNSCKDPGATVAADRVGPSGPLHLIDPSIPEPLAMLLLDCLEAQPHRRKKLAWVARVLASLDRQPTVAAN